MDRAALIIFLSSSFYVNMELTILISSSQERSGLNVFFGLFLVLLFGMCPETESKKTAQLGNSEIIRDQRCSELRDFASAKNDSLFHLLSSFMQYTFQHYSIHHHFRCSLILLASSVGVRKLSGVQSRDSNSGLPYWDPTVYSLL